MLAVAEAVKESGEEFNEEVSRTALRTGTDNSKNESSMTTIIDFITVIEIITRDK